MLKVNLDQERTRRGTDKKLRATRAIPGRSLFILGSSPFDLLIEEKLSDKVCRLLKPSSRTASMGQFYHGVGHKQRVGIQATTSYRTITTSLVLD